MPARGYPHYQALDSNAAAVLRIYGDGAGL